MKNASLRIACVDTELTLFAMEADAEGYRAGPEFGFNYARVANQIRMLRELDAPMAFGVYEPGHLRHARHYVNNGLSTPGPMWDFYLSGDYGLTAKDPIATNGMKPSLENLCHYLHRSKGLKSNTPGTSRSGVRARSTIRRFRAGL